MKLSDSAREIALPAVAHMRKQQPQKSALAAAVAAQLETVGLRGSNEEEVCITYGLTSRGDLLGGGGANAGRRGGEG